MCKHSLMEVVAEFVNIYNINGEQQTPTKQDTEAGMGTKFPESASQFRSAVSVAKPAHMLLEYTRGKS